MCNKKIKKQINVTDVTENFHTYGLERTKENLKFRSFMLMTNLLFKYLSQKSDGS